MQPYKVFEDSLTTLYQGDAWQVLQTLDDNSIDGIITDPPYSSGAFTLAGKQADPGKKYQRTGVKKSYPAMLGDGKDQRSFFAWTTMWLTECWRVAKDGAPVLVFTDWRQLPTVTDAIQAAGFLWRGIVVWRKRSGRPMLGEFRRESEFVVYGCKGKYSPLTRRCLPGVYEYAVNTARKIHVSSKPLPLLKDLMEIVPEGGTVLDPFIGGGTTAQAARTTGRKCIGIELSKEYAKITAELLKSA